jgi:hypothetical protein
MYKLMCASFAYDDREDILEIISISPNQVWPFSLDIPRLSILRITSVPCTIIEAQILHILFGRSPRNPVGVQVRLSPI